MSANKNRIMIVDDEGVLSGIFKIRYESEGFEVQQCSNGEEALKVVNEFKPDLIMLDLMMPKLSGYEVIKEIRSTPELQDTYIIIYSALTKFGQHIEAEQLGANEYIVKSNTSFNEVIEHITKVMSRLRSGTPNPDAPVTPT